MNTKKFFQNIFHKRHFKASVAILVTISILIVTWIMVGAQNLLPPEKQVIEEHYIQEQEEGYQNPAPRDPSYRPGPGPKYDIPTGILEQMDPPSGFPDFKINNRWQGIIDNLFIKVSAGGLFSDPSQGELIVETQPTDNSQDPTQVQEFLTPKKAGSVTIILEKDLKLVLKSSNGELFLFDVLSGTFQPIRLVGIDIKPGGAPNSVNCKNQNELIAVAILSTNDFNALSVDDSTVTFEGAQEYHINNAAGKLQRHEADVNGDGKLDLVFHFLMTRTDLNCNSTLGTLIGKTFNDIFVIGTDNIRMVKK